MRQIAFLFGCFALFPVFAAEKPSVLYPGDSNRVLLYYKQGLSQVRQNHFEEAIESFDRAIWLDPRLDEAYNDRGGAKIMLGRYEEAIKDFNQAIKLNPLYAEAYNNRGALQSALGRADLAIKDFNKAVELVPGYSDVYFNRANAKMKLELFAAALEDYNRAIKLNPDSIHYIRPNRRRAIQSLQKAKMRKEKCSQAFGLRLAKGSP